MPSCETTVDTASESVPRRFSGESYCDLYADVERTLHLAKDGDNRSAYRARSTRRLGEGPERKLSPRRQKYPQKSEVATNFHRSPSAPELHCPRKSNVDSEASKDTIPAHFEYEVAPEGNHNAEQLTNSPTSDTGSTVSQEELEIIRFLMNKTRVRHTMRSLSPKTAHSRASLTAIEGAARRNSDRDYSSKSRGSLSQKGTAPLQEARNARMASSHSRPRQMSFSSQASEPKRGSSRSRPRQMSFGSQANLSEPKRSSSRSASRQLSVDSPVSESKRSSSRPRPQPLSGDSPGSEPNRSSSRPRPRQQSFDSQASDLDQRLSGSRPRQQSFDSQASDLNQSFRSKAGDLRRRKRASRRRAPHNDRMMSLSPPTGRESSAQPDVSQLVERLQLESSSRSTDLGEISATAGYISRSAPDLGSSMRQRTPRTPADKRENDVRKCKDECKDRDNYKDKGKSKGKGKNKDKDRKEILGTSKATASLTTRSWRAKLAEHFGRSMETNPSIGKARGYRLAPIPTTLLCSDDFANDILDDLTEIP